MAEVDGMELLVRIHQRGWHMPVLMISGGGYMARDEVLALGRACGAVATLEKPFTMESRRPELPACEAQAREVRGAMTSDWALPA